MRNPLIGITAYYVDARELSDEKRKRGPRGQDMTMSALDYARCVCRGGGVPLPLPVINDAAYIEQIATAMDGFLFTGGPDIAPYWYRQAVQKNLGFVNPPRDQFEFQLLEQVLSRRKPVLAVCRGVQLLNVYFGGTLYQDIETAALTKLEHAARSQPKYQYAHKVALTGSGKLTEIFSRRELWVNSYHHQAVHEIGSGLETAAAAEDGIVEALESKAYPFVVGVQWHPEMMAKAHPEQQLIFQSLIDHSRREASGVS